MNESIKNHLISVKRKNIKLNKNEFHSKFSSKNFFRPVKLNIRFLLLDQGYKEGIDVFDVKYLHLFDDLLTDSDRKQAIGRGTRFCGQKGLDFNPVLGWPLHVFKYNLLIPDKLQQHYDAENSFEIVMRESGLDINKLID